MKKIKQSTIKELNKYALHCLKDIETNLIESYSPNLQTIVFKTNNLKAQLSFEIKPSTSVYSIYGRFNKKPEGYTNLKHNFHYF